MSLIDPDLCPSCNKPGFAEIQAERDARRAESDRLYARRFYVYRAYDKNAVLLYVGMTCDPDNRWRNHKRDSGWAQYADRFWMVGPFNRPEAAALEKEVIASEHPLWNINGRR